ncbi:helix-turn-helix domain-containing protein [Actinomadura opuntiae]|uniref:helix-turn-helix domain-containing protein n=1 Tax=Actinomadura sp. OS1-43 TaxID=604315 RepID=UPI00255A9AB3|nr:helix-turn-helix transcriptional regulator [Actinomadura sp. OS1-43]MDL4815154.1 helix-turn-helix transcriptional regulator [Actinomadura sp. OS1-43]
MTRGRSPVMQRRRLAAELHRLRAASEKTLDEVAAYLECSPAKISRIENNQVAVRIQDARELLDLYGVTDGRREELLQMVREARAKGWWSRYADLLDEGGETLLSLEEEAAAIQIYENSLVTGLLQTPAYARAYFAAWPALPLDVAERRVELCLDRQRALERANPPELTVVLDEAALRRSVGSPAVMREQLARLADASAQPWLTLLVLPFEAGPHQAMGFTFRIFEFTGDDPKVVYTEMLNRRCSLDSAEDVGRYTAAFQQVRARALDPAESRRFIEGLLDAT